MPNMEEDGSRTDTALYKRAKFETVIADIAWTFSLPGQGPPPRLSIPTAPPPPRLSIPTAPPPPSLQFDSLDNLPPISPPVSPSKLGLDWGAPPSLDKWAYSGFESLERDTSDIEKDYKYRQWQTQPTHHVPKEEQYEHIRHVLEMTLSGKYKAPWWKPMLDKVLENGNDWMESRDFFTNYTCGREKANAGIFYDTKCPEVTASRLHIVDERRYKIKRGTFFEQIKRQLRVNPMHIEVYKDLVNSN